MDKLIKAPEMAQLLGVPASWLYQRTRLGPEAIPHVRVGKYVRFDPVEVIAFLKATQEHGNSP